ncbi:MAG: ADP-forming succinate--CoA ligase subunit beta [Deltaproteobacteria bacterium]|nr:ADP-forming succinate--CoA ligase subunit beta [Deltaproteobacteria bacterium]MBI2229670.1 ADP-forming succinate--CoA ligase subunit beta [Deltaproteobacteria bacterium]MBI2364741.1 ADP-forming succinate--CoA ligase subunit beta [Deltaproteobacteria bacterium]MBI2535004.1 ADP-forming succinate--CoA ligase subunit beta [Deltaproteobacteria bacterium]
MNVHEYQAKEILKRFGVVVPRGIVATSPEEAKAAAEALGGPLCVVKAQIHAGGRGKGGGVKLARGPQDAAQKAGEILGKNLVTHQTGPQGRQVRRVLVEQGLNIERELYLAMVLDRAQSRVAVICSSEGGVEIEEVAHRNPQMILKETLDPVIGLAGFQCRRLAFALGVPAPLIGKMVAVMQGLYRAFDECDASLAEINPLVITREGEVVALDAKMNFDSNAFFRQKGIVALRDLDEEDPREVEAGNHDLSYISLDGNIACMVNGAGLAMATMDIIKFYGGEPANFLDVGGGADKEKVAQAFKILLADAQVRGMLINIFGGIMRCDVLAQGVVDAARELRVTVPLVVRMQGTNVDEGKRILKESGLAIISAETMAEAAEKIVKAVRG